MAEPTLTAAARMMQAIRLAMEVLHAQQTLGAFEEETADDDRQDERLHELARQVATGRRSRKRVPTICRVCGCTPAVACEGGCTWADAGRTLCSRCAPKAQRRARR